MLSLGTNAEGIIKTDGTTCFVPFCLAGERVRFSALKVKGNIAYGKLAAVLKASEKRVKPLCPVFGKCGGCVLQHAAYGEQLAFKREALRSALSKIGGIDVEVGETVACSREYRYRNKLALPIGADAAGKTVVGFYAPASHRIVPVSDCAIQSEWVKDIISATLEFARKSGFCGYDELKRTGVLRHIVVREIKGAYVIALVASRNIAVGAFIDELEKRFGKFTLLLNVNSGEGNAIFGKEWHICRGEGFYEAEEQGILYKAGANTFLQVNDDIRAKLYARVIDEAEGCGAAIDLYSGGGMLTAMLAKKCGRAYGIEIVEEASRCADELKEANGLRDKMFNICGAVEDELDGVLAKEDGKKVVVCDPPRKGMERSVVRAIINSGADKVIYVSCNPATLARDAGLLTGALEEQDGALIKTGQANGAYSIESVTPFDMFPQTRHVETLICFKRKQPWLSKASGGVAAE